GVLALQGDYMDHVEVTRKALQARGVSGDVVLVKDEDSLKSIDAIIIPGGESTVIGRLLERAGMLEELRSAIAGGLPTLGTCAGAILLAKKVRDRVVGETRQPIIGVMSIGVLRNAFGRQRESFEMGLEVSGYGRIKAAFIRAPAIVELWGDARELSGFDHPEIGRVAALAVEGSMIASIFHPEVTGETLLHETLIDMVKR
ncbi:MAG: pyridoxal 5'-phosphate synthase glutaminase subunit PdxT, partial [Acidilobaceae archaeon]